MSAENLGDLYGISDNSEDAGEGVSYAQANIREDRYPDVIVLGFDTYGGEPFVADVANSAIEAARGMKNCNDVSEFIEPKTRKIPGVGYVSPETDDPVVVAAVDNIESVGVVAGAMIGAALGNKNVYLVKRGTNWRVQGRAAFGVVHGLAAQHGVAVAFKLALGGQLQQQRQGALVNQVFGQIGENVRRSSKIGRASCRERV